MTLESLVGQKYGKLTVLIEGEVHIHVKSCTMVKKWICRCSCGNTIEVRQDSLRSGNTRSCGCLRRSLTIQRHHGKSDITGVYWSRKAKKWSSQISVKNKCHHLGFYVQYDNAVCARLMAEQCVGKKNSPAYKYIKKHIQGIK
ncbi:MAG: hypothetical protein P9L97_05720 [Candidatus Tenebribacter davisii]|nr:hypothetical protein [Candidatus Tenebribacter davisii]